MSSFKQTEIGLIPEDWEVVKFEKSILRRKIKVGKIKQQEYKKFGKYPVIDQSQNYIAGFCDDDDEKVYRGEDPKFLFYAMLTLNIPSRGYNRHYKLLREKKLLRPPLPEQRKIARVLDKIQQAIELQDRIIEQAKRLKKSLMQKLFTEGLYGEEQKETEIGLIPKSWTLVNLGDVFQLKSGKTRPKTILKYPTDKFRYPVFGGNGILGYSDQYLFEGSTIVIGRVGEYCGIAYPISAKAWITDNALYVVKKKIAYSEYYLANFLNYYNLNKFSKRAGQPVISQGVIYALKIPLPPLEEQKQIAHILSVVDKKIEVEQKRKQVLKALFKTMLHKLMSGEIRLKEVEI